MASNLFKTKPLSLLLEEMKGENRLRRVLGPVTLTSLGVGAIIGTGIFVLVGLTAHDKTGPALMLSFTVAGVACIFAAVCYAEFASMVPVAGSVYTYAYATLGELFAWIIGWDLVLEYSVSSATVANGWSKYFQDFIGIFGYQVPAALAQAPFDYDVAAGVFKTTDALFDLPALVIVIIITIILVKGIKESATFNTAMVITKLVIILMVIGVGAFYINPDNWHPFAPYGMSGVSFFGKTIVGQEGAGGEPLGMLAGAGMIFFAYIGFDSISTHAEEARQPQRDVPIGLIASLLICTVLYIAVAAVLTGMVPYNKININAPVSGCVPPGRIDLGAVFSLARRGGRDHVGDAGIDAQPAAGVARDSTRRIVTEKLLRRGAPAFSHPLEIIHRHRNIRWNHGGVLAHPVPGGTRKYRHLARVCNSLRGGIDHAQDQS